MSANPLNIPSEAIEFLMLENNQKKCSCCKLIKSYDSFSSNKAAKDGKQNQCANCMKEYRRINVKKISEKRKIVYEANKEKILENKKNNYVKNVKKISENRKIDYQNNKEKIIEKSRVYRENNKQKILENKKKYYRQNREQIIYKHNLYSKTPKGKAVLDNSKHKRRQKYQQGDTTTKQLLELKENSTKCYWCNCNLKNIKIHIDHYIPLSKGGTHTISNLVISCATCNLIKKDKDPIKFANSLGKLL